MSACIVELCTSLNQKSNMSELQYCASCMSISEYCSQSDNGIWSPAADVQEQEVEMFKVAQTPLHTPVIPSLLDEHEVHRRSFPFLNLKVHMMAVVLCSAEVGGEDCGFTW